MCQEVKQLKSLLSYQEYKFRKMFSRELWWGQWHLIKQVSTALQQPSISQVQGKDKCQLVHEEVRTGVEDLHASQMVRICQQGACTRWEQALEQKSS